MGCHCLVQGHFEKIHIQTEDISGESGETLTLNEIENEK